MEMLSAALCAELDTFFRYFVLIDNKLSVLQNITSSIFFMPLLCTVIEVPLYLRELFLFVTLILMLSLLNNQYYITSNIISSEKSELRSKFNPLIKLHYLRSPRNDNRLVYHRDSK